MTTKICNFERRSLLLSKLQPRLIRILWLILNTCIHDQCLFSPQVNIVVFILVIREMMGTRQLQSKTQIEKVKAGIKASAVILPLLGITWLFGLLAFNSATIAFKYIFAIANSLQGFMIFIFHCLLNKQVRTSKKLKEIVMCYTSRRNFS